MISIAPTSAPDRPAIGEDTRLFAESDLDAHVVESAGVVDLHSHLIPAVDDGAQTRDEAGHALAALHAQGVRAVVTTPHFDASLSERPQAFRARMRELDAGWEVLRAVAERAAPGMRLERGVELRLDSVWPDVSDARLRLAGGRFVLVEFAYLSVPPHAPRLLRSILEQSVTPVIAHVERYWNLRRDLAEVRAWRDLGAHVQVNTGSLVGRYGREPRERAFALLRQGGLVTCLATDFHGRGTPVVSEAERLFGRSAESEWWKPLAAINPARILDGLEPLPVSALPRRVGFLRRLAQSFAL